MYVPSAPQCNGHDQQTFKYNDSPTWASITCGDLPWSVAWSSAGAKQQRIGVRWERSNDLPIPAVLTQLQTVEHIQKVQVFFCSSYWQRTDFLVPHQLKCMKSRPSHGHRSVPTTVSTPNIASELRAALSGYKGWALPPMCIKIMALFFSKSCQASPTNEWFSMTIQAIKRRRNGYVALSSPSCGAQKASMLWQAMGTAALSYAIAWCLAGLMPLKFPWDRRTMDATFQQWHDWLLWYGTLTA